MGPAPFQISMMLTLYMPTPQNGQTQTIYRLLPTNCLSVFDYFVGWVLKGLTCKLYI